MVHNQEAQSIECDEVTADEKWSFFCPKKQKHCCAGELEAGDCWIGVGLDKGSGLILSSRVDKHTGEFIEGLVVSTEGKTDCKLFWYTDS